MNEIACLTMLLLDNLKRSEGQKANEPDRIVPGIPVRSWCSTVKTDTGIPLRSWCGTVENTDSGNIANRAVDIPDGATIYYLHPKTG